MRLAVIGNKEFDDYGFLKTKLETLPEIDLIVSGGASGVDTLARQFAQEYGIPFLEFAPDYAQDGSLAKIKRNRRIIEHCDKVIAFTDDSCASTKYTIHYAQKINIEMVSIKIR
jgi:hypothetical protein